MAVGVTQLSAEIVRDELARILASPSFAASGRLSKFLQYVVERTLTGESAEIKESVIGVEVFRRDATYDPRIDPVVRVMAGRLRQRLQQYYETAGRTNPIRIELPKGGYSPQFLEWQPIAPAVESLRPASTPERRVAIRIAAVVLLTAALGGTLYLISNRASARAERSVPLTSFRGLEMNPALSPDGNHVAFTWNGEKQDNFDIYVMATHSGTPLRLTTDPADDVSPAWSPDGRSIAFLRGVAGDHAQLIIVPASGGPEHKFAETETNEAHPQRRLWSVAWSPDGRWVAVPGREPGDFFGREHIYLFSLTGEKRRLTSPPRDSLGDHMPAFSPDGRFLAFCRFSGYSASDIYVVPLDTNLLPAGEPSRLTTEKRWAVNPVWTRNGRGLLYLSSEDYDVGPRPMRMIDISHPEKPAQTVSSDQDVWEITVGGPHFVYSRRIEDTNIWRARIPAPGNPPTVPELFISSTRRDQSPCYSPDGKRIVFTSSRTGSREIWIANADGSSPIRMTFFGGPLIGSAKWSPDGH